MSLPAPREPTDLDTPQSKTALRLAGSGFASAGFMALVGSGVQLAIDRGAGLPTIVFQVMHILSPAVLAVAASVGFMSGMPRVARRLSAATVVALAAWAGWWRFGLPALDWTIPRILLGIGLAWGGVQLIRRAPLLASSNPTGRESPIRS